MRESPGWSSVPVAPERYLASLVEILLHHSDLSRRRDAAAALGVHGDGSSVPALARALRDPGKEVRAAASSALASLGPVSVGALMEAQEDPDWVVRYRAAEALGSIRDERAVPALLRLLGDERDHVRYMAARGLGKQGDPRAMKSLSVALGDENEFVRRAASDSLAVLHRHERNR